jgi:uncharacterized protein YegP (UPF0339 family)
VGAAVAFAAPLTIAANAGAYTADMKFQIYKVKKTGQFRWRLRAANNKTIATSDESHVRKESCRNAIEQIQQKAASAVIEDLTLKTS